MPTRNYKHNKL